jgi:NADPH:quinone reductase-like Zn-dependent oxidoreductase
VGPGVRDWRPGDRAVALVRHGGYARDLLAHTRNLFRYPETLTPVEAAAVPVAFLTAWVALFESARSRPGETALVLGAAGGVGTAGGPAKCTFVVERLKADGCFDSGGDWEAAVRERAGARGVDVALDAVGGPATAACRRLLAPLGRLVFYGMSEAMPGRRRDWPSAAWAWLRTPRIHPLSLVEPNIGVSGIHLLHLLQKEELLRSALEEIYRGVEAGDWRPVVDRTFPLTRDGAVAAHHHLHARRAIGKVVLADSP